MNELRQTNVCLRESLLSSPSIKNVCGFIVIRQNCTTECHLEHGWFGRSLSSNDVVVKRPMSVMT